MRGEVGTETGADDVEGDVRVLFPEGRGEEFVIDRAKTREDADLVLEGRGLDSFGGARSGPGGSSCPGDAAFGGCFAEARGELALGFGDGFFEFLLRLLLHRFLLGIEEAEGLIDVAEVHHKGANREDERAEDEIEDGPGEDGFAKEDEGRLDVEGEGLVRDLGHHGDADPEGAADEEGHEVGDHPFLGIRLLIVIFRKPVFIEDGRGADDEVDDKQDDQDVSLDGPDGHTVHDEAFLRLEREHAPDKRLDRVVLREERVAPVDREGGKKDHDPEKEYEGDGDQVLSREMGFRHALFLLGMIGFLVLHEG